MKIGIFDSGLGGLLITRSIHDALPQYDTVYLGDTLHVPYGNRSKEAVYQLSLQAVDYLFDQENCQLIIIACNTASASALRRLQQEYLPRNHPERRILGVVVPTLETAIDMGHDRIGLIATPYIVQSKVYEDELIKLNPDIEIFSEATPLLVPLIEHNGTKWARPIIDEYLAPLQQQKIESLILGCTHYPHLKSLINESLRNKVKLISQDEIIPKKLQCYLKKHREITKKLTQNSQNTFYVTDITDTYINTASSVYGKNINLQKVTLPKHNARLSSVA